MLRTFAYVRVSTIGRRPKTRSRKSTRQAAVPPLRSGAVSPGLMDRLESGHVLIVTKLDRLGRDAIDVSTTVSSLPNLIYRHSKQSSRQRSLVAGNDQPMRSRNSQAPINQAAA